MKKGRAKEMTRPEPTINGNCDSWDSIVGKKGDRLGAFTAEMRALRVRNEKISTAYQQNILINQNPRTVRTLRPALCMKKPRRFNPPRGINILRHPEFRPHFYQNQYVRSMANSACCLSDHRPNAP